MLHLVTIGEIMKNLITVLCLASVCGSISINARTTGETRRDHFERVARVQNLARELMTRVENEAYSMRPNKLAKIEASLYLVEDSLNGIPTRPTRPTPPREYSCDQNPQARLQALAEGKILDLASTVLGYGYSDSRTYLANWSRAYKCESADLFIDNAKKLSDVAQLYLQFGYTEKLNYIRRNTSKLCRDYNLAAQASELAWVATNRGLSYTEKGKFIRSRLIKAGAYDCPITTVK